MTNNLESLLDALDASQVTMTRDPCGDYVIRGKFGHIYADGAGYLLCAGSF
jgi:hypothetical protein